jgi:hypothetical protein
MFCFNCNIIFLALQQVLPLHNTIIEISLHFLGFFLLKDSSYANNLFLFYDEIVSVIINPDDDYQS